MPKGEHKGVHLRAYDFKPKGEKPLALKTITVRLPPELDEYVRSKGNKNQWMIQAVIEKVMREREQQAEIPHNPF